MVLMVTLMDRCVYECEVVGRAAAERFSAQLRPLDRTRDVRSGGARRRRALARSCRTPTGSDQSQGCYDI